MNIKKVSYIAVILAFFAFSLTLFASDSKAQDKQQPRERPFIFAGDSSFAPFSFYLENSSGNNKNKRQSNLPLAGTVTEAVSEKPAGFSVDLCGAISEQLGREIIVKLMPWRHCIGGLKARNFEGLIGAPIYAKWEAYMDYSKPIAEVEYAIFIEASNKFINSLESLEGTIVAVPGESPIIEELSAYKRINLLETESIPEAINKLANREVTAVIAEKDAAIYYIQKKRIENLKIVGAPVGHTYAYALAVREGEVNLLNDINRAITVLEENGTLEKLRRKWLGLGLKVRIEPFPWKEFWFTTGGITGASVVLLIIFWAVFLNISIKKATQQIHLMSQTMVEKDKLAVLGTLAGQIAHELRTPLSVIHNSVFLLRKEGCHNKEAFEKRLHVLEDKVKLTSNILESILSYSRVKAQTATIISIEDCIHAVLGDIDFPEGIEREVVFEEKEKLTVFMDFHQLYSVIRNLVINAIQAMGEKGKVTIKSFPSENAGKINIRVCDTGHGIMKDAQDKIFSLFYSSKITGTGLGLPISKSIMEANNGTLKLESTSEKGTCFLIVLASTSATLKK